MQVYVTGPISGDTINLQLEIVIVTKARGTMANQVRVHLKWTRYPILFLFFEAVVSQFWCLKLAFFLMGKEM